MTESVVSPDLTQPLSLNEYLFCLNNPFAFLDADGRLPADQLMENSVLTSLFSVANRTIPSLSQSRPHKGVDFVSMEKNIHAAARGEVYRAGYDPKGWGNFLILTHRFNGERYATIYAHLESLPKFEINDQIFEGQVIGRMGSSGNVTGPHLHFEIRKIGQLSDFRSWYPINPGGGKHTYFNLGSFSTLNDIQSGRQLQK